MSLSSSRSLLIEKTDAETDAERVKAALSNPVKPEEFIAAGVPMRFGSLHSNSRLKGMKKNGKGKGQD